MSKRLEPREKEQMLGKLTLFNSINEKADKMQEEVDRVRKSAYRYSPPMIAKELGITKEAVYYQKKQMGV